MAQLPFLPFMYNDFLGSTRTWSGDERWTYLMLLIEQWENYRIPKDMPRLCRIDANVEKYWHLIGPKFDPIPDNPEYLQNLRLEEIRKDKLGFSQSQSEKAKKRWDKVRADAEVNAKSMPEVMPKRSLQLTSDFDIGSEVDLDVKKNNTAFQLVDLINRTLGRKYQLTKSVEEKWKARVREGFTIQDVSTALTNAIESTFHKEKGFTYLTPEFFTRSNQIEKWKNAGVTNKNKTDFTENDYSNNQGTNAIL